MSYVSTICGKTVYSEAYLVIRRRSKKLGDPRRRGIDGDLDDLDDLDRFDAALLYLQKENRFHRRIRT